MFKWLCSLFFLMMIVGSEALAKAPAFIDGLEDIPLMKGLVQKTDETVSFGNEESRFVEVSLSSSKVGFKAVEKFYKESLPQLGWTYQGSADNTVIFYRDSESLNIHKEGSKPLKIRIIVKNRI